MKKCYLKIYLNKNLGDDLFAKIISERYKDIKFITTSYTNEKYNFKNIKIFTGWFFRGANKILKVLTKNKITIEKMLVKKYKKVLVIGGSMFIEGKSEKYEELKEAKKYQIIGTNFGPYTSQEYLTYNKEIFKNAEYVCFRDNASYNLFKEIGNNINVAPDIIFGMDTEKIRIVNNSKMVIFSIIDCSKKLDIKYQEQYENQMLRMTKQLINKGYEIVYMSFCRNENDEIAIEKILAQAEEKVAESVKKYYYRGNLDEALDMLGKAEIIVGGRLHANILGLILGKTVIPVIYSNKTKNILEDIQFKGKIIDIKNIKSDSMQEIMDNDINYHLDIREQKEKARNHLKKIEQLIID